MLEWLAKFMLIRPPMAGFLAQFTNHPECPIWFDQHCYAITDYLQKLRADDSLWLGLEEFRVQVWQDWKARGYDPWGISERCLLGVYGHASVQQWVRESGWVHLLQLSGVHWIYLRQALQGLIQLFKGKNVFRWIIVFRVFFWSSVFFFWLLCGLKWGMLRPILQLFWSEWSFRSRWSLKSGYSLLGIALIELFSEVCVRLGFGVEEWSYWGRLHYFLAVWGTSLGFRYFRSGAMASLFSWMFVLPLSLVETAPVSLVTPLLNWISSWWIGVIWIPFLFLDLVFKGVSYVFFDHAAAEIFPWLQRMEDYLFAFTGFGVTWVSTELSRWKIVREWNHPWLASMGLVVIFFIFLNRYLTKAGDHHRSPSRGR